MLEIFNVWFQRILILQRSEAEKGSYIASFIAINISIWTPLYLQPKKNGNPHLSAFYVPIRDVISPPNSANLPGGGFGAFATRNWKENRTDSQTALVCECKEGATNIPTKDNHTSCICRQSRSQRLLMKVALSGIRRIVSAIFSC